MNARNVFTAICELSPRQAKAPARMLLAKPVLPVPLHAPGPRCGCTRLNGGMEPTR